MEEHTTNNASSNVASKGIWYVLAVVLLLLFVFGLATNKKKDPEVNKVTPTEKVPMREQTKTGAYAINLSPGSAQMETQPQFSVGRARTVAITMDTAGRQVLGYNLILQYDPNTTTIGKITSAIAQFTAYQKETTPGYIVIDGVKTATDNTPIILSNKAILNVPVTVKSEGMHTLRLVDKNNKDEAKFFDETMNPYYPSGAVVTIQSK